MLSSSNSVALDVRQRCQSLRKRRRLLVDAHLGKREPGNRFRWSTGFPWSPAFCLRCLLEQLTKTGERFDLERMCVADDVFAEALACGEDFLRSSDIGDEHVLWDRYDDRQPTSGAAPVGTSP